MADALGRAALTIGGAFFFGPVGGVVGGILGDLLFPVKLPGQQGPRLSELNFQRSTVGAPIPIAYGTAKMAGNVIFSSGLIEEVSSDEVGGKGSAPSQTVTTFSYFVDIAIGICDGEDGRPSKPQGIRRIWADADLILDFSVQGDDETDEEYAERLATSEQTLEFMTIYPGDEDQLASPMIQAYEGVGNVSAYRGLYHVEFERFPLDKYGNRIPNFTFEIYTGTATDVDCTQYSVGTLYPWIEGTNDPRNDSNQHIYTSGATTGTFEQALAAAEVTVGRPLLPDIYAWKQTSLGSLNSPCLGATSSDRISLFLRVNSLLTSNIDCTLGGGSCSAFDANWPVHSLVWVGNTSGTGLEFRYLTGESPEQFTGIDNSFWTNTDLCVTPDGAMEHLADVSIEVERQIQPPSACQGGTPIPGAPGFCILEGVVIPEVEWTLTAGTFKALQRYADDGTFVTSYPANPCLPLGDDNYNDQAFWEAAYAQVLADGAPGVLPGWTYGVEYPDTLTSAYVGECVSTAVETVCVPMPLIVADICDRAGLRTDTASQIDVSDLTTCPDGYVVTRQMSARDALTPLRMYGLWDCVESGDVLKFRERGTVIVASLTDNDLGAHDASGDAPSLLETARIQEKDLPRRVRLHYADLDQNHEPGEQSASRTTTEATNELDVEVAVSMTADYAAQLAEIMLYEQYVARNTYRFTLDNEWMALEPADCLEVPVDGETERVRVLSIDYSIGGILRIEAVRDDDGSYESTAVATPQEPSGGGGGAAGPVCPTEMVLLDLPRLRDEDVDCGVYAALYGLCDTWACAAVYRSSDGGATYGRIARTTLQATVGEITGLTGVGSASSLGDSPDYDNVNIITVNLLNGTLSSVTDEQILAGANSAAIGVDGRWVIIQFKTAVQTTEDTWELSDILWGLRETDDNLSGLAEGDTFVFLNSNLLRLPETFANNGVTKQYKAVTCGQAIDDAEEIDFATQCLSYKPEIVNPDPPNPPDTSDVIVNPDCAQVLTWDEDTQQYIGLPPKLVNLCDVEFDSSVQIGDHLALVSNDTSGPIFGFVPAGSDTSDTSGLALDDLSDVEINVPAEGEVLVYDGTSGLWVNAPAAASGVALTPIGKTVVAGAPATAITVSGLDLDADGAYLVLIALKNAAATSANINIHYNADTTATNYFRDAASNGSSTQANTPQLGALANSVNSELLCFGTITRPVSRVMAWFNIGTGAISTATIRTQTAAIQWVTTGTNVTDLTISSSVADLLDIGSRVEVYRLTQ